MAVRKEANGPTELTNNSQSITPSTEFENLLPNPHPSFPAVFQSSSSSSSSLGFTAVFQSKVLRKLYASAQTLQKESTCSTLNTNDSSKLTTKKITSGNSSTGNTSTPAKRIYTVLPPPEDYKTHAEKSVSLPEPETQVSAEDPAENNEEDSSCAEHQTKDHEGKKRRRRKKQKDRTPGLNQTKSVNEGEERMSKNKKRKLKKKRHKEKLLSKGLLPRAAAVEFIYQREGPEPGPVQELGAEEEMEGLDSTGNA